MVRASKSLLVVGWGGLFDYSVSPGPFLDLDLDLELDNLSVSPDIQDSCLTGGVETTVRIVQHTYNDDNDPEFVMYVNNEVSRSVMK